MDIARTRLFSSIAAVAAVAGLATSAMAITKQAATEPSVTVFDQSLSGDQINISYAYIPRDGHIVVYAADGSGKQSGEPLGSAALKAGSHVNVKVKLDKPQNTGTKLWVALYEDKDGKPGFTKGADLAVWEGGRLPLENQFAIR